MCRRRASCISFPGITMVLEAGAHIGHGAVIHGARIGRNVLVGMSAVIMDRAFDRSGLHHRRADLRAGRPRDP